MEHIAIMKGKEYIKKIINGEKTIESRLSKTKISPYERVRVGDTVFLKESGGNIVAKFIVKKIVFFEDINPIILDKIKENYNEYILAPDSYWSSKINANYGTLIYIDKPEMITSIKMKNKNRSGFISNVKVERK